MSDTVFTGGTIISADENDGATAVLEGDTITAVRAEDVTDEAKPKRARKSRKRETIEGPVAVEDTVTEGEPDKPVTVTQGDETVTAPPPAARMPQYEYIMGAVNFEDERPNLAQALAAARLDFDVEVVPTQVVIGGRAHDTGRSELVRVVDGDVIPLGAVKKYQPTQNLDVAGLLADLTSDYPVRAVFPYGAAGFGAVIPYGTAEVAGDQLEQSLMVLNPNLYGKATQVHLLNMRLFCVNQVPLAQKNAVFNARVPHNPRAAEVTAFRVKLVAQMDRVRAQALELFGRFAEVELTHEEVAWVLAETYPEPGKNASVRIAEDLGEDTVATLSDDDQAELNHGIGLYDQYAGYAQDKRAGVMQRFAQLQDEEPQHGRTAWQLLKAGTEYEDWLRRTNRADGLGIMATQALVGNRFKLKSRLVGALMQVVS